VHNQGSSESLLKDILSKIYMEKQWGLSRDEAAQGKVKHVARCVGVPVSILSRTAIRHENGDAPRKRSNVALAAASRETRGSGRVFVYNAQVPGLICSRVSIFIIHCQ